MSASSHLKPCTKCGGSLESAREPECGAIWTPIQKCTSCGTKYRRAWQNPGFTPEAQKKVDEICHRLSDRLDKILEERNRRLNPPR